MNERAETAQLFSKTSALLARKTTPLQPGGSYSQQAIFPDEVGSVGHMTQVHQAHVANPQVAELRPLPLLVLPRKPKKTSAQRAGLDQVAVAAATLPLSALFLLQHSPVRMDRATPDSRPNFPATALKRLELRNA